MLDHFNNESALRVQSELRRCCGSSRWVQHMLNRRPFASVEALFKEAEDIWWNLDERDWREAFTHHPKIGDIENLRKKFASTANWASGEQAGAAMGSEDVLKALAEGNKRYEEKFGYIFIVCATGKSADEMLAILESRLPNSPESEIRIAAAEQAKIIRLRLEKLQHTAEPQPSGKTSMNSTVTPDSAGDMFARLRESNYKFTAQYPGDSGARQPVHTVYGGAQIFKADTAQKLGEVGLRSLLENAPDFVAFAKALRLPGSESLPKSLTQIATLTKQLKKSPVKAKGKNPNAWLAYTIYHRVIDKLTTEPVEDFRIDFEDGYGNRVDSEEDHHAQFCAEEVARGMKQQTLPPFIGIRIKPMSEELKARSIRTLDIFVTTLARATLGALPSTFVITIPKVTIPQQVTAVVDFCKTLESKLDLKPASLKLELMVETPQSIFNSRGESHLPLLVAAGEGRFVGAHFGVYDYTALCEITAAHQYMRHPACDFARHMMKVSLAQTGINISDGATNIMPVGPHRAQKGKKLTARLAAENRVAVHRAWKLAFDDTTHSLTHGFYQGWDLHPAQLCVRYAAVYAFFLEGLDLATLRLKSFMEKAAQATLIGDVFDDAATGQGLLNYFLRGMSCRAITEDEALATGLTLGELRSRSFVKILNVRRGR